MFNQLLVLGAFSVYVVLKDQNHVDHRPTGATVYLLFVMLIEE